MFPSTVMSSCDGQLIWRNPPDLVSSTLDNEAYLRYKYRLAMEQKRRRRPPLTKELFVNYASQSQVVSSRQRSNFARTASTDNTALRQDSPFEYPDFNKQLQRPTKVLPRPKSLQVERWLEDQQQFYSNLSDDKAIRSACDAQQGDTCIDDFAPRRSAFTRVKSRTKDKSRLSWNGDIATVDYDKDFGTFPVLRTEKRYNDEFDFHLRDVRPLQSSVQVIQLESKQENTDFVSINDVHGAEAHEERPDRQDSPFIELSPVALPLASHEKNRSTDFIPLESDAPARPRDEKLVDATPYKDRSLFKQENSAFIVQHTASVPNDVGLKSDERDTRKPQNHSKSTEAAQPQDYAPDVNNFKDCAATYEDTTRQDASQSQEQQVFTSANTEIAKRHNHSRSSAGFKRASGTLKHLINLHEGAIARVSGKPSQKNNKRSRHSVSDVVMREHDESSKSVRANSQWKRHTAIGLSWEETQVEDAPSSEEREPTPPPVPPKPRELMALRSRSEDSSKENSVVVETHFISVSSAKEQFENLAAQTGHVDSFNARVKTRPLYLRNYSAEGRPQRIPSPSLDKGCQTDLPCCMESDHALLEVKLQQLMDEKLAVDLKYEEQIGDLQRRLDEQKKVANAYQKLEDRYRRQVNELQQTYKSCICGSNRNNGRWPGPGNSRSMPRNASSYNEDGSTIAKADGILNELESWLNEQQSPQYSTMVASSTDGSSVQVNIASHGGSVVSSLSDFTTLTADHQDGSPLDMIDQFDATCV